MNDDSDDYSSNDDVSCHGGKHSDKPPFSSSSDDDDSDVEFQGKSMPPDYVLPMETHAAGATVGAINSGTSSINSLGSISTFVGDSHSRSHKKKRSSKKSKKHHKKAKYF